jgi:hypothetical protein
MKACPEEVERAKSVVSYFSDGTDVSAVPLAILNGIVEILEWAEIPRLRPE